MSDKDNIKVAIRVRPLSASDIKENRNTFWEVKDSKCVYRVPSGPDEFYFDRVFGSCKKNHDVYTDLCQPIVKSVMEGFNGTIFAYGQTASGKTFTMTGKHGGIDKGVIQYAIEEIFDMIQETPDREFLLRASVIEIYNEKVKDLLSDKIEEIKLQEDREGVVNVTGLKEETVQTSDQILELLRKGLEKRRTGETKMNDRSSRSHFIFRMILESTLKGKEDSVVNVSQLNFVDLAGSENARKAKTVGERTKEGGHINKSLLALSNVINQLSEKTDQFINYRNSKLTRLLQNSLGGNAVTAIICTVSPSVLNETFSTLHFASSAKKIKNKPKKNEFCNDETLLKTFANEIKKLSRQLEVTKERGKELEEKTKQNEDLKKQIELLKAKFVCQTVESKAKAVRRETWGGRSDCRRFFEPRNPSCQLPLILEEEFESPELLDCNDTMLRHRSSRGSSISVSTSLNSLSKVLSVAVQTDGEILEENTNIEEAMTLVSELKNQLTTLQNDFAELTEYTTLERQLLKAENELQVEIETLKEENCTLRKALESSSLPEKSHLPVSNELKQEENDLSRNEITECIDNKFSHEIFDFKDLNNSFGSPKSVSAQKMKETSKIDITNSTLLDESLKSNFLAFYDECVENEVVSKLKSEIESLKYDIELKDKQLSLLNDKMLIKEQFIISLKDEIALGKNIDSPNSRDKSMREKIVQMHESCQTDFTSHISIKSLLQKECQTSPLKPCETTIINCYELNNFRDINISPLKLQRSSNFNLTAEKCNQTSPSKLHVSDVLTCYKNEISDVGLGFSKIDAYTETSPSKCLVNESCVKCVMEDQLTQVTPIKLKELSTQYCRSEMIDEHCVQTSPIKGLALFSEHSKVENYDVDQCTQVSDSFVEECNKNLGIDDKERNLNVFIDKSIQTPETFSEGKCEPEVASSFCDEMKNIVNKISELKIYTCNFMKNCAKAEYLKIADISESDVNDGCSKSALNEIVDLENLIMTLEFYIRNRDEDCEIFNSQLESKFQEVILLNLKLSDIENSLNAKESELSNLRNMFFDLKQSFSQLTFICQVLNNVDSEDKFVEIKNSASMPVSPQSNIPEYEMTLFKKLFVRLDSYMEENASKIISLSENLKRVKSELALMQKEKDLKLFDSSNVILKNTFPKSTQTSHIMDTADTIEKDKVILKFKSEVKNLQEQNNELEQRNKDLKQENNDLKQEIDDLKQEIDDLKQEIDDFETAKSVWNLKTETLVKDLEAKYDQELIDQESKLTKLHSKNLEHLKQLHDLKEEMVKMETLHKEELSDIKKQHEEQLFSENFEKANLKRQFENEKEQEIQALKMKYNTRQRQCREVNAELKVYLKHYSEEIEKLKKENIPSNHVQVFEQLNEKINKISDERDLLRKKFIAADQQISELKGHISHLKHKLKKINEEEELKQNTCSNSKEIEEMNKKLLCDLDQKKAKIMSLQANNASMLQEVKKLKEILSSKTAAPCRCKSNSRDSKPDIPEKHEDKKEIKSSLDNKSDLDVAPVNQAIKQRSLDGTETPKQNDSNNETPDQKSILCIGGGSGPANMVKNYWLEGIIHKKDREISKLREELDDLNSQLKNMKSRPLINEEKKSEAKKPEITRSPISPLQEVDENITVQVKTLHPYHGGAVPKVQRKQILKEKNATTCSKPYEKVKKVERIKKENAASDWQYPTSDFNVNRHGYKAKNDAIDQLADPECKQQ